MATENPGYTFLGRYLELSHNCEVAIFSIVGIFSCCLDKSLFNLNIKFKQIWDLTLDEKIFSSNYQLALKYIITSMELVRTFTVHLFLACYIVMLWPVIYEDRPKLMLPWLMTGVLRNIVAPTIGFICVSTFCVPYKFALPVCIEFFPSQILDYGPSIYTWFSVLSFYKQLVHKTNALDELKRKQSQFNHETVERRRKLRSIYWEGTGYNTLFQLEDDNRHLISASTLENVLNHLSTKNLDESRSLDSLLQTMATEADKREIMTLNEDFKEEFEKEEQLCLKDRIAKMLGLTPSDIAQAKRAQSLKKNKIASDIGTHVPPEPIPIKKCNSEDSCKSKMSYLRSSEKELRIIAMNSEESRESMKQIMQPIAENTSKIQLKQTPSRLKKSGIPILKKSFTKRPESALSQEEVNQSIEEEENNLTVNVDMELAETFDESTIPNDDNNHENVVDVLEDTNKLIDESNVLENVPVLVAEKAFYNESNVENSEYDTCASSSSSVLNVEATNASVWRHAVVKNIEEVSFAHDSAIIDNRFQKVVAFSSDHSYMNDNTKIVKTLHKNSDVEHSKSNELRSASMTILKNPNGRFQIDGFTKAYLTEQYCINRINVAQKAFQEQKKK